MSKSRIFLITPFENGLAKRGTRCVDIAETLHDKGWDVNYYTTNFSHAYKYKFNTNEIRKEKRKRKYNLRFLPILGYRKNISFKRIVSNFKMSYDFYRQVEKEINDHDYVMIPSRPVDFIYFVSKLKNKYPHIKLIMDIRDVWPDAFAKKNIFFELYCKFFLERSVKKFDAYIHTSPSFIDWLRRFNPKADSEFIPLGFSKGRFNDFIPLKKNCGTKKIVFIGALQYQLDILPLIKAIKNDKAISLTIIGEDGKGQRYQECISYILQNQVDNVEFKGVMDPSEVSEELKQYDIGVMPMISNSITNKLFDYIASYLPILVLGQNDSSRMVLNHQIGWQVDFDPIKIREVLTKIAWEEINQKMRNISRIRPTFERTHLYQKIPQLISSLEEK